MPWLEPDINDVINDLAAAGRRGVIVVPIGFVSDHVEVVWDLDNEAAETAAEHDLFFARVGTPGVDPRFVAELADLVEERLDGSRTPAIPSDVDLRRSAAAARTSAPPAAASTPGSPGRPPRPSTRPPTGPACTVDPARLAASGIRGTVQG